MPTPEEIAAMMAASEPVEDIAEFRRSCRHIREMLRSAELRAGRLYAEGNIEEYNDLVNGIWEVSDTLSNTQYEDY